MHAADLKFVNPSSPILSQVAAKVPKEDIQTSSIKNLIKEMKEVAGVERSNPGQTVLVGLAAPQIGVLKRIILVDTGANGKGGITTVKVYINPVIVAESPGKEEWYEACYSTGCVTGIVKRARAVTVRALNENKEEIEETHEGYVARIFQHEIDHLDGKRFPEVIQDKENLHWVEKEQFPEYRDREGWRNWPNKCPYEKWEAIRDGKV